MLDTSSEITFFEASTTSIIFDPTLFFISKTTAGLPLTLDQLFLSSKVLLIIAISPKFMVVPSAIFIGIAKSSSNVSTTPGTLTTNLPFSFSIAPAVTN